MSGSDDDTLGNEFSEPVDIGDTESSAICAGNTETSDIRAGADVGAGASADIYTDTGEGVGALCAETTIGDVAGHAIRILLELTGG